ncbi:MAG: hypothetical protein JXA82_14050 [Sedimentisphaerales bacterium]|nr:hypothetical protein [Sedimentisphaerales bacterium]
MPLFYSGCDSFPFPPASSRTPPNVPKQLDVSQGYLPTHIRIMGLTGFKHGEYGADTAALEVYIDMLDHFDCRIKAPGIFRLELYEYVPRSSNPRGKRIMIWDDIDLTDAGANNEFWRDFLRCYQFNLPIVNMPPSADPYILEATCITLEGKQLTTMFHLTGNQEP